MTDKENLLELLESWSLAPFVEYVRSDHGATLSVGTQEEGPVYGEAGFTVEFNFSADGKFLDMGIWE